MIRFVTNRLILPENDYPEVEGRIGIDIILLFLLMRLRLPSIW